MIPMRWKLFLAAILNFFLIAFPYNIIGCAGSDDPYDYYTGFFDYRLGNNNSLQAFYYTYDFLWSRDEPVDQWEVTARDWIDYSGVQASPKEAKDLTGNYTYAQLQGLYTQAEKGTATKLPDSVMRNRLVTALVTNKDLEALGYLMYLRKIEPYVQVVDSWDPPAKDISKSNAWANNGISLYNAVKKDFFRQRYAYQVARLNLYGMDPDGAIQWADKEAIKPISPSIHELTEAIRAGALYRRGDKAQSAYRFCQLFAEGKMKKVSNYYGYHVYTHKIPTGLILGYCKTEKEKANVLATIAMGNPSLDLTTLERISRLSPGDTLLDMLAVREINKIEEKYLSRNMPSSGASFAYNVYYEDKDTVTSKEVKETAEWMQWMTAQKSTQHPGLYATGAAYLHFINKDYPTARQWLQTAKEKGVKDVLADQWRLTELLITINEQPLIDSGFEAKLLPSIQWLETKAVADRNAMGYYSDGPWTKFYRNLMNSVIAPRYEKQGDKHKKTLAIGAAENIRSTTDNGYSSYQALSTLRNSLSSADALRLEAYMRNPSATPYEKYLIKHTGFSIADVQDVVGTTLLREDKLDEALVWFNKINPKYYKEEPYATYMAANPFADLLLDIHAPTAQDTVKYSKAGFTKKMIGLKKQFNEQTDPNKKAKLAYELAKGYYNMTYWGNAWLLVAYDWSGSEGDWGPDKSKAWHKEYYSASRAETWFQKAHNLYTNKEMKARSLFMLAKCVQKKGKPSYKINQDYNAYNKAKEAYHLNMIRNPLFIELRDTYGSTAFYKEALNTCSYLKDFHTGKTKMPGK